MNPRWISARSAEEIDAAGENLINTVLFYLSRVLIIMGIAMLFAQAWAYRAEIASFFGWGIDLAFAIAYVGTVALAVVVLAVAHIVNRLRDWRDRRYIDAAILSRRARG